jgi:hypothetical protein
VPDSGISDGSVYTSAFHDSYVRQQVIAQVTSATRPTGVEGRVIYETDTNRMMIYNGSAWMFLRTESETYTPTLGSMVVGTGGSASNTAVYSFSGGVLTIAGTVQFGTSGATYPGASNTITLPATFTPAASETPNYPLVGIANMTAGGVSATGVVALVSSTQLRVYVTGAGGTYASATNLSTTVPGTWAAGDYIRWTATLSGTLS